MATSRSGGRSSAATRASFRCRARGPDSTWPYPMIPLARGEALWATSALPERDAARGPCSDGRAGQLYVGRVTAIRTTTMRGPVGRRVDGRSSGSMRRILLVARISKSNFRRSTRGSAPSSRSRTSARTLHAVAALAGIISPPAGSEAVLPPVAEELREALHTEGLAAADNC